MTSLENGQTYVTATGVRVGPIQNGAEDFDGARIATLFASSSHPGMTWLSTGKSRQGPHLDLVAKADDPVPQPVTKASMLEMAKEAVADRGLNYGRPEDNFERIARLWQTHLINRYGPGPMSFVLDAADVAQMMVLMKIARLENQPNHLDSWVDLAGYAACGAEITNGS